MDKNLKAFLDLIAWCEGTKGIGDDGYNVSVRGASDKETPTFDSYAEHPRRRVFISNTVGYSDAAGRYQIMGRFWTFYKGALDLPDFGHDSQDKYAINLIRECKAYALVVGGNLLEAIKRCRSRWASLPGANYPGQKTRSLDDCVTKFKEFGGTIAE